VISIRGKLLVIFAACCAGTNATAQNPAPAPQPEKAAKARTEAAAARAAARVGLERVKERSISMRNGKDDGYQQGTSALDRRDYEQAIKSFDHVIGAKSSRAEGAYYWKAYALNRLGKRDEALASLGEISKQFPRSRWLTDAKALEAEVKQASGRGVAPENQADEDLKLYAINALSHSDPERTLPLLEKLLTDAKNSPRLKERALFVLAQTNNEKARAIVTQYAKGGGNPDLQLRAVEYVGTFRSKEGQQTLASIYSSSSDPMLKRAVLRGYMMSRDTEHLMAAAKGETNAELRREAISGLGALGASDELMKLYQAETTADGKESIIRFMLGKGNLPKLVEIAKTERDSKVRMAAIRQLGMHRDENQVAALSGLYAAETDKQIKKTILEAFMMQGSAKPLIELARKESDPELKRQAVRMLSSMHSKEATDFMMELLSK
jgi:HEAT repeat protein